MLLGSKLPDRVVVRDLGDVQLKDVERERIFQLDLTDADEPEEERLREACRSREGTLAQEMVVSLGRGR